MLHKLHSVGQDASAKLQASHGSVLILSLQGCSKALPHLRVMQPGQLQLASVLEP